MYGRPTILEIATTNYETDKDIVFSAMDDLQKRCEVEDGFIISKPMERFGWAFFKVLLKDELESAMLTKLESQIALSQGKKIHEKFVTFMTKYFEHNNAKVKVKLTEI